MRKLVFWLLVASVPITLAVLEVLVENIPQPMVQINGFLVILLAVGLVGWNLKPQASSVIRSDRK